MSASRRVAITPLNAMMSALLPVFLVFMIFPDRVRGENLQQTLFRKDANFNDLTVVENAVLEESEIKTAIACASLCAAHSQCESFFYNGDLRVCSGQPSSLDAITAGFNEPGSAYFKPVSSKSVSGQVANGSCFDNVTQAASSNVDGVCGGGDTLALASEVANPAVGAFVSRSVTRQMTVDGHCVEDRWTWDSGNKVSLFCIRHCLLLDPTQNMCLRCHTNPVCVSVKTMHAKYRNIFWLFVFILLMSGFV